MVKCTFDGSFEFNKVHGFHGLHSMDPTFYEDKGQTLDGTKVWLFIDMPEVIEKRESEVIIAKNNGIKIISLFYDEVRFPVVDRLIEKGLIDKLILFDKQYKSRFSINTLVSDYYVNSKAFPDFKNERNGKMCYFGNKLFNRSLPNDCEHVQESNFNGLYETVSHYSKGYVASTGKGENGGIIYHNKGKYIEMLFCGLRVQCQKGIETINYEEYKNKFISIDDLEEIHKTNDNVIDNVVRFINE